MNVLEPSAVHVPVVVKKIGLVNRTLPTKETKPLDDIEKALSLEGLNLDKEGADATMVSVKDRLSQSDRYTELKPIEDPSLKTIGAGVLPQSLSWDQVAKLCKTHQVDALLALEFYDTDTKLDFKASNTTVNTPLGNVPSLAYQANMNTNVKTGWRFYDPQSKVLIDEYHVNRATMFTSSGNNPLMAAKALIHRKDAVNQISTQVGAAYAERILPYWTRVKRDYYIKGNDQLKTAARKAQAGNWDGAAEIWKQQSANADAKIAGRACYNYAIIHEINGNLDEAIKWAQKAYEDYNEKLALGYIRILQGRKERMKRLDN